MPKTNDLNIVAMRKLISPKILKKDYPTDSKITEQVWDSRNKIADILEGADKRLLAIIGPCSIHDPKAALEYAKRLTALKNKIQDKIFVVMRVYFEKPRTTIGWRGFLVDPDLDGSQDIEMGLRKGRELLIQINQMGIPTAGEVLDPIVPQYLADLMSWAAIGARTTESQTHRDISSGLSMPVGFKNGTDGNLDIAINAMLACREAKSFIGIDQDGQTCVLTTKGNPASHVILRGGKHGPNYDASNLDAAEKMLTAAKLNPYLMVDCSHANSQKDPDKQTLVLQTLVDEIKKGRRSLRGFMIESNLLGGSQAIGPLDSLKYGVSITDPCLSWDKTEEALLKAHKEL